MKSPVSILAAKASGVLAVVFCLLLGAARFGPRAQPAWVVFLQSPDATCAMPCWAGIQPGQTRAEAAIALLREHPLGGRVVSSYYNRVNGDGVIVWVSGERRADAARGPFNARLRAHDHTIVNITLSSGLLAGDALLALGEPTDGETHIIQTLRTPPFRLEQRYRYADSSVSVMSRTRCPFARADLWRARAVVELGEPEANYSVEPVLRAAAFAGYSPLSLWRVQAICRQVRGLFP